MRISDLDSIASTKLIGLDIGCSGQKPMEWERFGERLHYFGIDPLSNEIDKLKKKYPQDSFLNAFIMDIGCTGKADSLTSMFFNRTSAYSDMQSGYDLVKENFNSGLDVLYTNRHLTMKEAISELNLHSVDILKIDVDGDDFALLKAFLNSSADLASKLLAFEIESQFHGDAGDYGNNFGNILKLANLHGFYLYKLDSYTYSRNELRKPYVHNFPAQTHGGQVLWADAVFMRDSKEVLDIDRRKKLTLILDSYDLEDCAFEILADSPDEFGLSKDDLEELRVEISKSSSQSFSKFRDIKLLILSKFKRWLRA